MKDIKNASLQGNNNEKGSSKRHGLVESLREIRDEEDQCFKMVED